MKKNLIFILICLIILTAVPGCSESSVKEDLIYGQIMDMCDGFSPEQISYTVTSVNESRNITLTSTGSIKKNGETYTYTYTTQYLNEIGSGAESLVSEISGTAEGTKDELTSEGYEIAETLVSGFNLREDIKVHKVTETESGYTVSGFLRKDAVLERTENLDGDIRFDYELVTDKEITTVKSFKVSYVTDSFDSIVIVITY